MVQIEDTSGQDIQLEKKGLSQSLGNWKIIGLGAACLVFLVWLIPTVSRWSEASLSVSADRIRVATVEKGPLVRDVSVQGRLVAAVKPTLYSPAQGVVDYVVKAGDTVEKGSVLATIESPELTANFDQAKSLLQQLEIEFQRQRIQSRKQALENQKSVDVAKVALTSAEREMRRAKEAWDKQAISRIDLERAEDELEKAQLAYNHAVGDAELNKESLTFEDQTRKLRVDQQAILVTDLERQVSELIVKSPVAGVVGNLMSEPKNSVAKHQPLMSVVDLSEFELELEVPETYSDDLAIGMPAEVIANGEKFVAAVVSISPEVNNNMVQCRLRFGEQTPAGLRQNQRLTSRILLESFDNVMVVKRGQFLESGQGRIAYKIEDGMARKTMIRTGARSLNAVQIVDGLKVGDELIISSTDLFNGADSVMITQ